MSANPTSEAFLNANANEGFIASQMAEVIRKLMRAASSANGSLYEASEQMKFIHDLISRMESEVSWWHVLHSAIEEIRSNLPSDKYNERYVHAAERGIKFFVESSAGDNGAKGRASKRISEFQQAIRSIDRD